MRWRSKVPLVPHGFVQRSDSILWFQSRVLLIVLGGRFAHTTAKHQLALRCKWLRLDGIANGSIQVSASVPGRSISASRLKKSKYSPIRDASPNWMKAAEALDVNKHLVGLLRLDNLGGQFVGSLASRHRVGRRERLRLETTECLDHGLG
ncbi:uncharacterized protein EI97DRAFT_136993 [Westerdykella ornata]|uniref:Uncharacterized protein n=1 Tax=Westerdykella ornata TaxID=318751 RepID=A0A6A6JD01_WESOR|nr:uncharacterized protein EI97DRAFT_136993 [Westerdykella ornata]KAF2274145.1 hypothetical protein EI97DRAFT_136993 [Westerdykella ornata]